MIPLADTKGSGRIPFITLSLIAVNIFAFFLEISSPSLEAFIEKYALIPSLIDFSKVESLYPFITSMFLHGDLIHLGSNMLFLWVFGDNVEEALGKFYLPFYILGGVVAALVQFSINSTSAIAILGASGAVAAVLGAYLILFPHHEVRSLVIVIGFISVVKISAPLMLGYWFLLQLISGLISIGLVAEGGIAWWAHIGGFLFGVVLGFLFKAQLQKRGFQT